MASASSNANLSLSERERRLWLGTYYFDSIPYTIENMNTNIIWKCEPFKQQYVDFLLEFQFVRISELEFRVTCIRTDLSDISPTDYILRFYCTINLLNDEPKLFDLQSTTFIVFQKFWLDASYRQNLSLDDLNKEFELKISVYMFEYNCLYNRLHAEQEYEFELLRQRYLHPESVANDMCYILRVPKLKNIYTGRQTFDFSQKKNGFIINTAKFSKEIANYLRAKEAGIPVPSTDLRLILNYILKRNQQPISNEDLIKIYLEAHAMGLDFLIELSQDCLFPEMEKIGNQIFMMDALDAVDRVNDKFLFDKVTERLQTFEEFLLSEKILDCLKCFDVARRFMAYTFERLLKEKIASRGPIDTGGASTSKS